MNKNYSLVILAVILIIGLFYTISHRKNETDITICTIQYIEHPNLEKMYRAFQEEINNQWTIMK